MSLSQIRPRIVRRTMEHVVGTVAANTQVFSSTVLKAEAENLQTTVNAIITALKTAGLMTD